VACELADARSGVDEGEKAAEHFGAVVSRLEWWVEAAKYYGTHITGAVCAGAKPRRFRRARQRRE